MEWQEYNALEPIGFLGADLRMGTLAAVVATGAGAKDVTSKTFMLSTAIEDANEPKEDASAFDQFAAVFAPKKAG